MRTNRFFIMIIWMVSLGNPLSAQMRLTIEECQEKARNNYPLIRQFGLIDQSKEYNLSNLSKSYLPQVSLNGQATYQSDVVSLPIQLPGIDVPSMDKDQYKVTIDATQTIWDGGMIRSQKKIATASNEVDKQNIEVNLYALRERVNQLFFGILTLDEQLNQLDILETDLQNSLKMTKAFLENGTGTSSDVDAIQVEILNTEQKRIELNTFRKAYTEMLSAIIHEKITEQTVLGKPVEQPVDPLAVIGRPEIGLFDSQRRLFDIQESSITAKNNPRFGLFVQGGYGKPGLNMLSNSFEPYALGGIKLSWNFSNLYTKSNEKHQLDIQKNIVNIQEETFKFNTHLQLTQVYNEIQKFRNLMKQDDEIITLRNRVKTAAESKYENGVYTVNDLVRDINAESQSRQAKILHEVQYLMNIYNYNNIQGN